MNKYKIKSEKLSRVKLVKGKQLKHHLNIFKNEIMDKKIDEWEKLEKSRGAKPKHLTPLEVAKVINECYVFVLFDDEENQKLAIYDSELGIYTQNHSKIKQIVSEVEPDFNEKQATDVIYHLRNLTLGEHGTHGKLRDPDLIMVNNGIYNKSTKELEDFTPEYVITTKINTNYVKNKEHPELDGFNFNNWLKEIANNDKQVERLFWEIINETLNGNYTRKKAFFLIGSGNNGKGTFQELLRNLVGEQNTAMLKANEFSHRFSLEQLVGKSLIIGDDIPPNVFTDDLSNFKSIVTGDPVSIEGKNKPIYHDVLTPTIIQSTNGMIRSLDKSNGLLRRIVIVPFFAEFEGNGKENVDIKEKYFKDSDLLEYVLSKAIELEFDTFTEPNVSTEALEEFKTDNDPIYEFKKEIIDNWESNVLVKSIVYDAYKCFCEASGYRPLSSRKFHKDLFEHLSKEWLSKNIWASKNKVISTCKYDNFENYYGYYTHADLMNEKVYSGYERKVSINFEGK